MELLLIRHGQANYAACDTRGFVGQGKDLAPLSDAGRKQADRLTAALDVSGAQLILSSPYTRALETAAALCRHTGLPLRVEMDLREWQPDTTFAAIQPSQALYADFCRCRGVPQAGQTPVWESIPAMKRMGIDPTGRYRRRLRSRMAVSSPPTDCAGGALPLCGGLPQGFSFDWVEGAQT